MSADNPAGTGVSRRTLLKLMGATGGTLVAAGLLPGCEVPPAATKTSKEPTPKQAASPVRGGRVVGGQPTDITSMNPVLGTDVFSFNAWSQFYLPLLRLNPDDGSLEPGLAEQFELAADGLTITYTLRDGLVWSDGEPFTGEDYRYTVEAHVRSQRAPRRALFRSIVGYEDYREGRTDQMAGIQVSENGRVITVQLERPFCPAIQAFSLDGAGILPRHRFVEGWNNRTTDPSTNIDDHPLNNAPPASIGPFVFRNFIPGVEASMVRNERYYRGAPNIDELIIKIYSDHPAVRAGILAGEADFNFGIIPPEFVAEVRAADHVNFYQLPSAGNYFFIAWHHASTTAPWLAVKEVRQALWHGLNVEAIVEQVRLGYSQQVFGPILPTSWAYEDRGLNRYEYNPERSRELLEQAGATMGPDGVYRWTDGERMHMRIESFPPFATDIEIAQEQYAQIGIEIEPVIHSLPAMFERFDASVMDREGVMSGFDPRGADPDVHWGTWHSSQTGQGQGNRIHYNNPDVDAALDAARHGEPSCDPAARRDHYARALELINEDAAFTFTYAPDNTIAVTRDLQNFEPRPFSQHSLWNIEQWWRAS